MKEEIREVFTDESIDVDAMRLTREDVAQAALMSKDEARALVGLRYSIQKLRVGTGNKESAHNRKVDILAEPVVIAKLKRMLEVDERAADRALAAYAKAHKLGRWAMSNKGVGPVTTAAFLAFFDVRHPGVKAAGNFMSYAGHIDPAIIEARWEETRRRPYNARLKTVCFLLGESFKKLKNNPDCYYARFYAERKELEQERNERGDNAERARAKLDRAKRKGYKISEAQFEAWNSGKLQAAGVDRRACRYAVCMFLSHYFHVNYEIEFGRPPARPWVIEHGGHVGYIPPPNWPMAEDLEATTRKRGRPKKAVLVGQS